VELCNGATVVAWLHALQDAALPVPVARTVQVRTHIVVQGETLSKIARKHACEVKMIARANNIAAPRYPIRVGQRLQLSSCRA
jgi:membrane-bound lytic murein transglycosylase D